MAYFILITEKTSVEELTRLFRDYIWKLHRLSESIISNKGIQFAAEIIRELNKLLRIQTKLLTAYYSQTDRQMKRINQKLEQYLRIFIDYRQEQWPEQLRTAEIGFEERKKGKFETVEKFIKKMKKIQREVRAALGKVQEEIKRYVDRKQEEVKEYKIGNLVLLSTKDLKWQIVEKRSEKLIE